MKFSSTYWKEAYCKKNIKNNQPTKQKHFRPLHLSSMAWLYTDAVVLVVTASDWCAVPPILQKKQVVLRLFLSTPPQIDPHFVNVKAQHWHTGRFSIHSWLRISQYILLNTSHNFLHTSPVCILFSADRRLYTLLSGLLNCRWIPWINSALTALPPLPLSLNPPSTPECTVFCWDPSQQQRAEPSKSSPWIL